jgi:nitrite reductase/ring-hydroxylating ferredoxin subunit
MRERERDSSSRTAMAEFVPVYRAEDLKAGDMRAFDVRDTRIAVANVAGTFYAFDDTCTHMGCSLAEGDLEETTVTCPCHGSKFDARSGEVLHGPAPEPVDIYKTRVKSGSLEIEG